MDLVRQYFRRTFSWSAGIVRKALLGLKRYLLMRRTKPKRSEQEIFEDLRALCCLPGFVHAMADICFRHNTTFYEKEMKASDMEHLYSYSRLIRTEITALIGLMISAPIRFTCPPKNVISAYASRAEQLLNELHKTIAFPGKKELARRVRDGEKADDINMGRLFREAFIYGGESAYSFQYRDFALEKYREDAQWLLDKRGLDLQLAVQLCRCISELLNEKLVQAREQVKNHHTNQYSLLPGFVISYAELVNRANASPEAVQAVINTFTLPADERNAAFNSVDDFNQAYPYPFISINEDQFLALDHYGLPQALCDTPFYWMREDKDYAPTAADNRGRFPEKFAAQRLAHVFGAGKVYRNVELWRSKGEVIGDIDVLVVYGDRAIVVQAKSKKLTIEARKGNDLKLLDDFQKAIQDAVDQSFKCSQGLMDANVKLLCGGKPLSLRRRPQRVAPIALIAEHYPALIMQVRQYLQAKSIKGIAAPLVIDVFALDATAELLCSPLRFLGYLELRARFGDNFLAHHEHTILSYHLRRNLWPEHEDYLEVLHDDFSAHLELAMIVRREGIPGADTPEGILTRAKGTPYAHIFSQLENKQNPNYIALGLFLLKFSGKTVHKFNKRLTKVMALTSEDGRFHGFSIGGNRSAGLTVHCSRMGSGDAEEFLVEQCRKQRDSHKAERWLGLAIRQNGSIVWVRKLSGAQKNLKGVASEPRG